MKPEDQIEQALQNLRPKAPDALRDRIAVLKGHRAVPTRPTPFPLSRVAIAAAAILTLCITILLTTRTTNDPVAQSTATLSETRGRDFQSRSPLTPPQKFALSDSGRLYQIRPTTNLRGVRLRSAQLVTIHPL